MFIVNNGHKRYHNSVIKRAIFANKKVCKFKKGDIEMNSYEAVIIGKGPAGISASLYTARAGIKTLVIGTDTSSLIKTDKIENYYGFEMPISGAQLLKIGEKQAQRLGVTIVNSEVTSLEYDNGFKIKTTGCEYHAKAVLIATGQPPRRPNLPGVEQFEGKGVSYCTTCDGFFYKNKKVGVLGSGNYAAQEAQELEPFTNDITIFTNGQEIAFSGEYEKAAEKYSFNTKKIVGLSGGKVLEKIEFEDGEQDINGIFIASGTASSVDFAVKLGIMVNGGSIITDGAQKTNVDGIFAAGDCTGGIKQVSVAVGEGAKAGLSMIEFIRHNK